MARLDVTDILSDPDFMDTGLARERLTQTVGSNGLAVNTTITRKFAGVVTSDSGNILERGPDGERIKGNMTIHTRFDLSDGSTGISADVVRWQGQRYTVSNVNSYSHFGRGFIVAACDLIPFSG